MHMLLLPLLLLLAACGGSSSSTSDAGTTTDAGTSTDAGTTTDAGSGTVHTVNVAANGTFMFDPMALTIHVGDTVHWVWGSGGHTVTSGANCMADNKFCSPGDTSCATSATSSAGTTYDHKFTQAGTFPYFCIPHCGFGMTGTVVVQ
jgi:plastocyanin